VKLFQHIEGDVRDARQSSYQPGSRIKHRLKRGEAHFRKAYKERVAVINARADEGMDYRRKDREDSGGK